MRSAVLDRAAVQRALTTVHCSLRPARCAAVGQGPCAPLESVGLRTHGPRGDALTVIHEQTLTWGRGPLLHHANNSTRHATLGVLCGSPMVGGASQQEVMPAVVQGAQAQSRARPLSHRTETAPISVQQLCRGRGEASVA